jgi:Flp pilus assembly protein TadD
VRGWYGRDAVGFQRFAAAFASHDRQTEGSVAAVAALTTDAALPPIVRASALDRLARTPTAEGVAAARRAASDSDPLVRRSSARLFEGLPPRDRLEALPLLSDASRAVRIEAARVLAPAAALIVGVDERRRFDVASREFIAAERLHADRPEARTNLGTFFTELGQASEAIAEYRAAVRLEPRFVGAYVNMAEGLVAVEASADLHHALGLSLARSNKHGEAVDELARAAALAPDVARFSYAHAVALHSTGRSDRAIAVIEASRTRHPGDRDLLFALATFQRDAGRLREARAAAAELRRLFPDDAEAAALEGALGSR